MRVRAVTAPTTPGELRQRLYAAHARFAFAAFQHHENPSPEFAQKVTEAAKELGRVTRLRSTTFLASLGVVGAAGALVLELEQVGLPPAALKRLDALMATLATVHATLGGEPEGVTP